MLDDRISMKHLVYCGALLLGIANAAPGADWYRWRGPNLDGISQETEWSDNWPKSGPLVAWKANVGTGFSSFVVSQGRVYTMGNVEDRDRVACLSANDGAISWEHTYECPLDDNMFEGGPTSTPTVDEDRLYSLSRQGDLFCLDAKTGKVLWSQNIRETAQIRVPGWGFSGAPLVQGKLLILNAGESGVAIDKMTGELVWTSADRECGYASPLPITVRDQRMLIIASARFYFAVDVQTGKQIWRHRWLTRFGCNAAAPIFAGDRLFLSSGYNRGSALLRLTDTQPEVLWTTKEMQNQFHSSVLIDGRVFGLDGNDTGQRLLKCVEFETGAVQWAFEGVGSGALTAAAGKLIVLSEDGELLIAPASRKGFHPTARSQVLDGKCWSVPVLSGGRLYCRNTSGDIVCLNLQATGTR